MRYIGSKARVASAILDLVGPPADGSVFVDAMCGTGAVAETAAAGGWPVRINDHLLSAVVVAHARLLSRHDVPFEAFGGYERAVAALRSAASRQGFLWQHYSPASSAVSQHERRYFTEANAAAIDGARHAIESWRCAGLLAEEEQRLLLADLLAAASRVANIAGTYGCFLREWSSSARRPFEITPRSLSDRPLTVEVFHADVLDVPFAVGDVAYFDPPYTKRQYAAYYHVLETIAHGDEPVIAGITGLRPWQERASDFCYKTRALRVIESLIADTPARRIFLSYSAEGHVPLADLTGALEQLGDLTVHALGEIGRYRPNWQASLTGDAVHEYLVEVAKANVTTRDAQERTIAA